jgi:hypothetical protein
LKKQTIKEVYPFANQTRRLFVIDSNEAIEESLDKLQKEENIYKSIETSGLENICETR